MLFEFHKYGTAIVVTAIVSLLLAGCGGGSGGAEGGGSVGGGFTVTGKITLADGTPINGATVKLYKTSYTIYTIDTFYSTRDLSGLESIKLDSAFLQSTTNEQGVYSFAGVYSGNYTIVPTSSVYVFKWSLEPTRSTIGVVTITDSGTVYIYNPEGTGNKVEGAIIYNTGAPYTITNNILDGQDFEASLPGGTGG